VYWLGENGNLGNLEVGATGPAQIEDDYYYGTKLVHWDEREYGQELMTGFLNRNQSQPFLSLLTIRSLQDMGLEVDLSQADAYHIPIHDDSSSSLRQAQINPNRIEFGNDVRESRSKEIIPIPKPGREADFQRERDMMLLKRARTETSPRNENRRFKEHVKSFFTTTFTSDDSGYHLKNDEDTGGDDEEELDV
jgi:hypothetical protein